jgi:RNA polymerase sigma factor (sigma-70 family)
MATDQTSEALQHLRRAVLLREGAGLTDGQLLEDYFSHHDEAALAALVLRHGPMVWGVCRRILGNYHDAEDAFQATFLVLVRKAASIAYPALLANWLYGVAHQTALKAKATAARRKERERQVTEMPEPAVAEQGLGHDLQPVLDQELSRLPDKYRAVVVLCDLAGKTRREAARQLGVPEGTVAGQLARARKMLAKRLARRGLGLSGAAVAMVLLQNVASAVVPISVVSNTIQAATVFVAGQGAAGGVISAPVAALTQGVLKTMLWSKLKVATAVLVGVLACVGGGAVAFLPTAAGQQKAQTTAAKASPDDKKADKDKKTDKDKLQGTWVAVSAERNGAKIDGDDPGIKSTKWTFDGDKVTMSPLNEEPCPYTLDPDKTPKEMDIDVGDGKKDVKLLTIYKFEGGRLKWHWVKDGPRPSDFDTSKSKGVVIVFEKEKE